MKKDYVAKNFFRLVDKRLSESNIVRNPFKGYVRVFANKEELFIGLELDPVYPPVYYWGVVWVFLFFIIWGFTWWLLPGVILFSLIFFYSRFFFYLFTIFGLRKAGYKGKVKLLSSQKTIERLLRWGR
jgi:hypothetical protein